MLHSYLLNPVTSHLQSLLLWYTFAHTVYVFSNPAQHLVTQLSLGSELLLSPPMQSDSVYPFSVPRVPAPDPVHVTNAPRGGLGVVQSV